MSKSVSCTKKEIEKKKQAKLEENQNKNTENELNKKKNELKKLIAISGIRTIEALIREQRISA